MAGCSNDDIYRDFLGGGGMYLMTHMLRLLDIQQGPKVLDLGCGKGESSILHGEALWSAGLSTRFVDLRRVPRAQIRRERRE